MPFMVLVRLNFEFKKRVGMGVFVKFMGCFGWYDRVGVSMILEYLILGVFRYEF